MGLLSKLRETRAKNKEIRKAAKKEYEQVYWATKEKEAVKEAREKAKAKAKPKKRSARSSSLLETLFGSEGGGSDPLGLFSSPKSKRKKRRKK